MELIYAIKNNNMNKIIEILRKPRININIYTKCRKTPLMIAIETNNSLIALELIKKGANINAYDYAKRTIAMYAAIYMNNDILNKLILMNVKLNRVDSMGRTVLMYYLKSFSFVNTNENYKYIKISKKIIQNIKFKNKTDKNGMNLLSYAIKYAPMYYVESLLNIYPERNLILKNIKQNEIINIILSLQKIHINYNYKCTEICNIILNILKKHGIKKIQMLIFNKFTFIINKLLDGKCMCILKILIKNGLNVNNTGTYGDTLLLSTMNKLIEFNNYKYFEMLKLIIDNGGNLNLKKKNISNHNTIIWIVLCSYINSCRKYKLIKYLINNGFNIYKDDLTGNYINYIILHKKSIKLIKLLLDNGAHIYNWEYILKKIQTQINYEENNNNIKKIYNIMFWKKKEIEYYVKSILDDDNMPYVPYFFDIIGSYIIAI